ncbi:transposase family protein [Streptomyces sp. NPDC056656]|uniref:transposase family protein n=1 Tax=Streptomyces sp. NPDC056656 TaxID=3345895 RepID=UPI0036B42B61
MAVRVIAACSRRSPRRSLICPAWWWTRGRADGGGIVLTARTVAREAACPDCGAVSGRVHGGYRRRLADVAAAGQEVAIGLLVRRFLCPAAECRRRTFVEQVDGLTGRFARRTPLLRRSLERIALALAGRPAAHPSVPTSNYRRRSGQPPTAKQFE